MTARPTVVEVRLAYRILMSKRRVTVMMLVGIMLAQWPLAHQPAAVRQVWEKVHKTVRAGQRKNLDNVNPMCAVKNPFLL